MFGVNCQIIKRNPEQIENDKSDQSVLYYGYSQ